MQWSDAGILASYKFLQKLWALHKKIMEVKNSKIESKNIEIDQSLEKFTNVVIDKVNKSINKFSYNTLIANFHEIYNFFQKLLEKNIIPINLESNYEKILKIMLPVIPHFASECLSQLHLENKYVWPKVDNKYLDDKLFKIVVQINGKKRDVIQFSDEIEDENELIQLIKQKENLNKFIKNTEFKRIVYIKNKLINIII